MVSVNETDFSYQWLDVSDIDDPDLSCVAEDSLIHLFASLLQFLVVDPLVVAWVTNIIEVL